MGFLETINNPVDLKRLAPSQLPKLAQEIREYLYHSLNQTGGHLAAGLGAVELTIALHYLYQVPQDKIIWDVGHQAYPHKILTERKHLFTTLRAKDGLAPFPRREESPYDAFGVGHSSTSISAGLGMSLAKSLTHTPGKVIAVIGDGAMTAGMAFEALNHAGALKANLLVILNDNEMSISPNVGALSHYLTRILASKLYTTVKDGSKKILKRMPPMSTLAHRTEAHLKGMIAPGTLFEELGFNYLGPIDGHDLTALTSTLTHLASLNGPQLLHIYTKKGKGYPPAEADPIKYHAVSQNFYTPITTPIKPAEPIKMPTYSQVFGDWLCDMAQADPRLVAITPAMREGSGMVAFSKAFPDRYFDTGIAEQHSVTFAAGLACEQMRPVVAIYSSFLQRAYDQLIHDVALQNLPVLFAIDRAGVVADGPTHCGNFDLSFLRCIPNMLIMAPANADECRKMLTTGLHYQGPSAVRYPRGCSPEVAIDRVLTPLPLAKARYLRQGKRLALLSFGAMLENALQVGEILNASVVDMRFVKPLDETLIQQLAKTHEVFITLEENMIMGGAGSAVNEYLHANQYRHSVINLGLPDYFLEHGAPAQLLASCQLDVPGILASIREKVSKIPCINHPFPVQSQEK
jgi:1-deoxy-D-xylulose-5-phosphate synthase